MLESDITHYDSLGEVYVCGDFNSRTGVKYDFVRCDSKNAMFDNDDYVPDEINVRASLDTKCNRFGSKLLDLCKSTCTRIVNGRIGDDQGAFTFMSWNGASVVDYLLSKECNFSNITCFNVGSINVWSDHAPLYFSLSCNNILLNEQDESYTTYKWSQKYKDQFRANLIGQLPVLNQLVTNIEPTEAGIDSVVCSFSNIVKKVADNYFLKHVNIFHPTNFVDVSSCDNTEWFDRECIDARNSYHEALRVFNCCKTDASRIYCCERKQFYKRLIKKKKRLFKYRKLNEIEELKKSKPKAFWKYFKKKNSKTENNIPLNDFFQYFRNLENDIFTCHNEDAENFCKTHDFDSISVNDELDKPISVTEIITAVKKLKSNKAYGSDCLLNEYFIESIDILVPYLHDIFNAILNSGIFPNQWREGIIVPIHKKGDKDDVSNYRGISLLSCFSKIFTSVLNSRVVSFCEENQCISDAQFGFKKGSSTIDAIFALHTLIEHYLNHNSRFYVAFIDIKKCFDSIYRNALWLKLYRSGLQGKLLRIIKDMYNEVKSCVKHCNSFSDYFNYSIGLRQGEIMSPILVSLFLEDLELFYKINLIVG